jgi:integrase
VKRRGLPRYWRVRRLADGRETYWHEPAARDRAAFPALRLADDKALALLEAERRNAEMDRWRAGLATAPGEAGRHPPGSFGAVAEAFRRSERFARLAVKTRRDYGQHIEALLATFAPLPIVGFTRPALMRYRDTLPATRQGNYRLAVLRLVLGYAYDTGELPSHPGRGLKGFKLASRDAYWRPEDEAAFLAHAPEPMRLALILGLYTGQREADVLAMRWTDIAGGWLTIRQRKTGRQVQIPIARRLASELERARAEQAARRRLGLVILIGERGQPYQADGFRHRFAKVAKAAGLEGLTFLDLRRTAVVRLAEAGCTVPEIAAITGHAIHETQRILDTYWRATRPQAAAAIAKLEAHGRRKSPRASPRGAKKQPDRAG